MCEHIMLVDDDPSIRFTVHAVFEAAGTNLRTASDGNECLQALEEGFTGLILMDVMMPGMDGWQTVKEIVDRGYSEKVLICMLTAKPEPDEEMDSIKQHVLDYFTKPFRPSELLSRVNEHMEYLVDVPVAA